MSPQGNTSTRTRIETTTRDGYADTAKPRAILPPEQGLKRSGDQVDVRDAAPRAILPPEQGLKQNHALRSDGVLVPRAILPPEQGLKRCSGGVCGGVCSYPRAILPPEQGLKHKYQDIMDSRDVTQGNTSTRTRIETQTCSAAPLRSLHSQGNTSTRTRIETDKPPLVMSIARIGPGQYFHQNKD